MGHDLCIAFGLFGIGFYICSVRLSILSRRDRRIAKMHLVRCRAWGLKTQHVAEGSINNLTLVVSQRLVKKFGRRVATIEAYADSLKREIDDVLREIRPRVAIHDGEMEGGLLDEGSTVVLRKEGANGAAG